MNRDNAEPEPTPRRFLIEVRAMLQVEQTDSEAALNAAREWIAATGAGKSDSLPPEVQVWWMRVEPERDDQPAWRRDAGLTFTDL